MMPNSPEIIFKDENTFYIANPVIANGKPLVVNGNIVKRINIKTPELSEITDLTISDIGGGHINTILELLVRTSTPSLSMDDALQLRLDCMVLAAGGFKQLCMGYLPED